MNGVMAMALLSNIFGQNSSGKNGASIFMRLLTTNAWAEFRRHKPWEIMLLASMGAMIGSFTGAAIHAGVSHLTGVSKAPAQEEIVDFNSRKSAPGVNQGATAGGLLILYLFFIHGALRDACRETKVQIKDSKKLQGPGPD